MLSRLKIGSAFVGLGGAALMSLMPATTASAAQPVPTYGAAYSGKSVSVAIDHEFKVSLATARDGGYSWHMATSPARSVLVLESSSEIADPHEAGTVGYGYHTVYLFKVVGYGRTTFSLAESRPWGSKAVAAKFNLMVHTPVPTYTERFSGKTVVEHLHGEFQFSLKTCNDCGMSWSFTKMPSKAVVKLESTWSVQDPAPSGSWSGTSHTLFRFVVVGTGTTSLSLVERQQWRGGGTGSSYSLTVQAGK